MNSNKNVQKALVYFSQFSINMLVPICVCSAIGYFIDKKLNTEFAFIIMFFLGALAGFRNIYIMVKRFIKNSDDEADK